MAAPNSRRNLDEAIKRLAEKQGDNPLRLRNVIANTVVAQMLPDGVVKGGSAIKLRLGDAGEADYYIADDVAASLETLGFSRPQPIPPMKLHYQTGQKFDIFRNRIGLRHTKEDQQNTQTAMLRFNKRLVSTMFDTKEIQTAIRSVETKRRSCKGTFPAGSITNHII